MELTMIIPNLYMFDPSTLEHILTKPAPVLDGIVLAKNAFGTTTPVGPTREGYAQVWRAKTSGTWLYTHEDTVLASESEEGEWYYIEDHRNQESASPYWLPEDDYTVTGRTMTSLGAYPKNARFKQPEKPYSVYVSEKKTEINNKFSAAMRSLTSRYPDMEVATFAKQEAEAAAYLVDPKTPIPYLTTLADIRGVDVEELVLKVSKNCESYNESTAYYVGLRHKFLDMLTSMIEHIEETSTKEELDEAIKNIIALDIDYSKEVTINE